MAVTKKSPHNTPDPKNSPPEPTKPDDNKDNEPKPSPDFYSKEAVNKMVAEATKKAAEDAAEKARKEEKDKLYPTIERHRASEKQAEEKLKELDEQKQAAETKLKEYEEKNLSKEEKTNKILEDLASRTAAAELSNQKLAEKYETDKKASELQLYRERKLREEDVKLPEMVAGSSQEEIDRSIESAKVKEKELFDAAYQKASTDVRKELGDKIPAPIEPGDERTKTEPGAVIENRESIVKLPPDEYAKKRAELLESAKKQMADAQAQR